MKKLFPFLLLLLPASCFAVSQNIVVPQFSGLDSQDPPSALNPTQSQDLLNVRLQPGGKSVFKRDGYGLFQSLPSFSTSPVHGGYHFQQSGGSDVQLWGSDIGLYASVNDSSFVQVATGTVGATWQCTDNLGSAYCVTSSGVDTPVKTDGTLANTTYVGTIPTGTIVTSTPLQLVLAGVPGNDSSVYVSSNNGFSSFGSGPLPTDPYIEIINAPGSRITHLAYYFGNLYWWKDQSFGYISGSASQGTVGIVIVSNQIGTLDDSSAFWNPTSYDTGNQFSPGAGPTSTGNPYFNEMQQLGGIFFRGQDNHIYQYDGYNLTRLSRIITPNIVSSSRRKADSWPLSTSSDWNSGTIVGLDTTTIAPAMFLNTVSATENFPDLSKWLNGYSPFSSWTVVGGTATAANPPFGTSDFAMIQSTSLGLPSSAFDISINANALGTGKNTQFDIVNISTAGYGLIFGMSGGSFYIDAGLAGSYINYINPSVSTADSNFHNLRLTHNLTGGTSIYFDRNLIGSFTDNSVNLSGSQRIRLFAQAPDTTGNSVASLLTGTLVTTGTFQSPIHNTAAITSWGTFAAQQIPNGGNISYSICSSTNSNMSSPTSCAIQSYNSQISIATGTYVQWFATFTANGAGQNATLNSATVNWFEGTAADKAYIAYFQDAVLFSVSSGSGTSTNNTIFYLDLLNSTWLKDNIPANGFVIENNTLYIGDPLSSNIYKFGGVTTDKGNPIQSYWKSMDFAGSDPTVQNEFLQSDFSFNESSTTIQYTYDVDQSTSMLTTINLPLYSNKSSIIKRGLLLSIGKIGTYFNFMVGDNSSNQKWTLMGHRTRYNALNWVPQTSN